VIGVGVIARRIVSIARTLGMRVIGVGRTARSGDPDFGDIVSHTDVLEVLPLADWLLVVAPRTALTEGLIDSHALKHLKPSARVVNVGRSAVLDQRALCAALARGRLAGAAVDVLDVEPAPPSDPVWTTPNLLVSPHMGGDLVGWRADAARLFLENLGRWRRGEPLQNVVDKALGYVAGA
jgi:phosphoglycerate dehydrogenase-like enzyme